MTHDVIPWIVAVGGLAFVLFQQKLVDWIDRRFGGP